MIAKLLADLVLPAAPGTAALISVAVRSLAKGLIANRSPLRSGSAS